MSNPLQAIVSPELEALAARFGPHLERLEEVELTALGAVIGLFLWDCCDYPEHRTFQSLSKAADSIRFQPSRNVAIAVEMLNHSNVSTLRNLQVFLYQRLVNL